MTTPDLSQSGCGQPFTSGHNQVRRRQPTNIYMLAASLMILKAALTLTRVTITMVADDFVNSFIYPRSFSLLPPPCPPCPLPPPPPSPPCPSCLLSAHPLIPDCPPTPPRSQTSEKENITDHISPSIYKWSPKPEYVHGTNTTSLLLLLVHILFEHLSLNSFWAHIHSWR